MCELQFYSVEMVMIAWCVFGSCVVVGIICYQEGARRNR